MGGERACEGRLGSLAASVFKSAEFADLRDFTRAGTCFRRTPAATQCLR